MIIPTNPQELFSVAKAHHMKGSKTNNFLHPLPFFSIINEAARFVGVSKMYEKRMGKSTEDDDTGEGELSKAKIRELLKTRIPKAQKLFLLDPRTSSVPKNPIQTEFETE